MVVLNGFSDVSLGNDFCDFVLDRDFVLKKQKEEIFGGCFSKGFRESDLLGVHCVSCEFNRCDFYRASFLDSVFESCVFHGCSFSEPLFVNARLKNCRFYKCTFDSGSFENSSLSNVVFDHVAMPKTHFFNAHVEQSVIHRSDLKNTVLFGTEFKFIIDSASARTVHVERPLSVVLVNPETQGVSVPRVVGKLANVGDVIPIKIAMHAPHHQKSNLDEEVEQVLQGLNSGGEYEQQSIPQRMLLHIRENHQLYPNALAVLERVKSLAANVHSVVLPGGEDISPLLYGQNPQPETGFSGGYHRSLLEFALIEQCTKRGMPLMGVCRGFQVISIFFGAKLLQHIGQDQVGIRQLTQPIGRTHQGVLPPLMGNLRTAVFHHQAVPAETTFKCLEVVAQRFVRDSVRGNDNWNVVMAVEQAHGAPVIGFQFHPEFFPGGVEIKPSERYERFSNQVLKRLENGQLRTPSDLLRSPCLKNMSIENEGFWSLMGEFARVYNAKKQVLSLL